MFGVGTCETFSSFVSFARVRVRLLFHVFLLFKAGSTPCFKTT